MSIIIYPPIINWDYMRQRPQQLMLQFARNNHTVLYFNKTTEEGPVVTQPADNLYVIHHPTFFLDYIYPAIETLDKKVYWSSWSKMIPFHTKFNSDFLVYDCVDDFPDWESDEKLFSDQSDIIVCTADKLESKMKAHYPTKPIYKIPNGCEWNYFSQLLTKSTLPSDHMRIGYIGAWAPWVNADLIRSISENFPQAEIKILGPDFRGDTDTFNANVHFFGHVHYEDLLDHLTEIDVLILPFSINRITESTNPIKIYEYLATGKPIVSTNLPEVEKLSSAVYVAKNEEEFIEKINWAFKNKESGRSCRSNFAKQFSWEERFNQIKKMFKRELSLSSKKAIDIKELVSGYKTKFIPMEYCTVNSFYIAENLRYDPIFVGRQGEYEYQCFFKSKFVHTISDAIRVYFEMDITGEIDGELELILSKPVKPWFKHELTFANKPQTEVLSNQTINSFTNTITFDVTPFIEHGKVPMFHLQANTEKLLRFTEPRLTFVKKS